MASKNIVRMRKAYDALSKARKNVEASRVKAQLSCKHPEVYEGSYVPSDFGSSIPPFRVCGDCGYAEEGWGCGYSFLEKSDDDVIKLSRDKARRKVLGRILDNDEHREVFYGEKSLRSILESD